MIVGFTAGQGGRERRQEREERRGEREGGKELFISLHLCRYSGSDTKINSKPLPGQQGATLPPFFLSSSVDVPDSEWQMATRASARTYARTTAGVQRGDSDTGAERERKRSPTARYRLKREERAGKDVQETLPWPPTKTPYTGR